MTHDKIGQILNICYVPLEDGRCGGIYQITKFEDHRYYAKKASVGNGPVGDEFELSERIWYYELEAHQQKAFIRPEHPRVRPPHPPSMCPPFINNTIVNPENSFILREQLNDTQIYLTHDNGGRPFKVLAHRNAIEIYTDDGLIFDEKRIYNILVVRYENFIGLWPGYDSADYSPTALGMDDDDENENDENNDRLIQRSDHNSILIKLQDNKYVFGDTIYSFENNNTNSKLLLTTWK